METRQATRDDNDEREDDEKQEWSDRDFGLYEELDDDIADRRRDPMRR